MFFIKYNVCIQSICHIKTNKVVLAMNNFIKSFLVNIMNIFFNTSPKKKFCEFIYCIL